MSMTFEQRKLAAQAMVAKFLRRFSPPRGMIEPAQAEMIDSIADALARKLPVMSPEMYRENIEKTFANVLDTHDSYAWPPQAVFVKSIGASVAASSSGAAPETYRSRTNDVKAQMMNEGKPVPEKYVWGTEAAMLLNAGLVTQEVIDRYRMGAVQAFESTYREAGHRLCRARYGDIVTPYFKRTFPGADAFGRRAATAERPAISGDKKWTKFEWEKHVRIVSNLTGLSFDEAEAREVRELSPDQLPEWLAWSGAHG